MVCRYLIYLQKKQKSAGGLLCLPSPKDWSRNQIYQLTAYCIWQMLRYFYVRGWLQNNLQTPPCGIWYKTNSRSLLWHQCMFWMALWEFTALSSNTKSDGNSLVAEANSNPLSTALECYWHRCCRDYQVAARQTPSRFGSVGQRRASAGSNLPHFWI